MKEKLNTAFWTLVVIIFFGLLAQGMRDEAAACKRGVAPLWYPDDCLAFEKGETK